MSAVRCLFGSFLMLVLLFSPLGALAKLPEVKVSKEEGPVEIEADFLIYDQERKVFEAHGQVEVVRGGLVLKANHAELNQGTKDLAAWGDVILREGENVLECERMEMNLETQVGKVYQARLFLKDQNYHIVGKEAERLGEDRYRIREGSFTTCDETRPPWKFTVKELDVTMTGQGIARGPLFYVEDVPILYFPKAVFPVKRERQSGFLIPEVGYSSTDGLDVRAAFYWAMRKDMDATFYFGVEGERGPKEGVEYRYAFDKDSRGQANFYFIHDSVYEGNRDAFFWRHDQRLPEGFYLKTDINYVSDIQYPRDFDEDLPVGAKIDSRSLRLLRSVVFGGKDWDQFSVIADGMGFIDLTTENNDRTVQKLPQVSFYAHPQSLFGNSLFWDLTSTYTNFYRKEGVQAQRGYLTPRVSYPVRVFDGLKLEPAVAVSETLYSISDAPLGQFEGWKNRLSFQGGIQASTELYRIYDEIFPGLARLFGVSKWMHTIEPTIAYLYSPDVNQDEIPIFDDLDRIPATNQIFYGITQRLVGKPLKETVTSGPREYARLTLYQLYSLGDPFDRDTKGNERYFSDIFAELDLFLNPYMTGRIDVAFNPYDTRFNQANGLLTVRDKRNDAIQLEYRYTTDRVHEGNAFGRIRTFDPLYLFGGLRYNLLEGSPVETFYGAHYQGQCFTLGATLNHIYESPDKTQRGETRYWFYVSLLGIGDVGHKPFFMGL